MPEPVGETRVKAPHTDLLAQEVAEGLSRAVVAGIVTEWRGPFGDASGDKRLRRGPWYEVSTIDGRHAVYTRAEVSAFTDAVFAAERALVPAAEVERLRETLRNAAVWLGDAAAQMADHAPGSTAYGGLGCSACGGMVQTLKKQAAHVRRAALGEQSASETPGGPRESGAQPASGSEHPA